MTTIKDDVLCNIDILEFHIFGKLIVSQQNPINQNTNQSSLLLVNRIITSQLQKLSSTGR